MPRLEGGETTCSIRLLNIVLVRRQRDIYYCQLYCVTWHHSKGSFDNS
jgi:hypothetical protein